MKTQEELNVLKEEAKTLNNKLAELKEEELKQVTGSGLVILCDGCSGSASDIAKCRLTDCPQKSHQKISPKQ